MLKQIIYVTEIILSFLFMYFFALPQDITSWRDFITPAFTVAGILTLIISTHYFFSKNAKKASQIMLLFGMAVALFLTYHHYVLLYNPSTSFCSISQSVSCDIVNTSSYSELFGIPIALFGFLTYTLLLALLLTKNSKALLCAKIISSLTVLFTLYLIYVSKVLINAWCPLCMLTYMVNMSVFVFLLKYDNKQKDINDVANSTH